MKWFNLVPLHHRAQPLRLSRAGEVAHWLEPQFDAFERAWGAPPDHVDGHQHVQQFAGIREALLACIARRYASWPAGLRIDAPQCPLAAIALTICPNAALVLLCSPVSRARGYRLAGMWRTAAPIWRQGAWLLPLQRGGP